MTRQRRPNSPLIALDRSLTDRLTRRQIRVDTPDDNTVWFRNVPTNERFYNKATTSVLVTRPGPAQPFVVCVDEDLHYQGTDDDIVKAFAAGHRDAGWRVILVDRPGGGGLTSAVERALVALGSEGGEPQLTTASARVPAQHGLLSRGVDLTAAVHAGSADPCVGRAAAIDDVCRHLLRERPLLPLIVGAPGVGKTNLLHGLADRLSEIRPALRLVRIDFGALAAGTRDAAERAHLMAVLLQEAAASGAVMAIEHVHVAVTDAPHGALALGLAIDTGARLIGTTSASHLPTLVAPPLGRRIGVIALGELPLPSVRAALAANLPRIAHHLDVSIDEALLDAVVDAACASGGPHPAAALDLLDAAATTAAIGGRQTVTLHDLYETLHARTLP